MKEYKIAIFSCKSYDKEYFEIMLQNYPHIEVEYFEHKLDYRTAMTAKGFDAVCIFVNDRANRPALEELAKQGIKLIALRCAGFDNVDLKAAADLGIKLVRVPAYSPESVAEHAVALMMTLNRRTHKAYQRTRDANFALEGLTGFNMFKRTVGIIGTGKIGIAAMKILKGFGMNILAFDPFQNEQALALGAQYVDLDTLFAQSDVISLHCPMTPENHHLIDKTAFSKMKKGVMIINTSRGGLLDSHAAIDALKEGIIGALGMDVYEKERELFFEDKSNDVILDDVFRRLSSCHNVLFTGHQAFLTKDALLNISETTLKNVIEMLEIGKCVNEIQN